MKKCLNCGKYNDYFLCESCREEQILSNIYGQIRSYDPKNCENTYLIEYASTLTEKYQERDIIPEILSLFPFAVAEYYYCMYYVMRRDDRFEEAAIAYLSSHDDKEEKSHRILYSLLKSYIRNDYIKPQKWCEYILDRDYLPCDLYPLAAEYYGMIGEYDRAELLLKRAKSLCCSGNECRFLYSSAEKMTTKIEKQLEDIHRYRTKKPYWPATEERRRAVAMFYDEKGIKYPRIESKPIKVPENEFLPISPCYDDVLEDYCAFWCADVSHMGITKCVYQIAAVKVRGGIITDTFQSFIRPWDGEASRKYASKKAGVALDVIESADDVDIVTKRFFDFVGTDVLSSTGALGNQAKLLARMSRYSGMNRIANELYDILDLASDTSPKEFDLQNNTREYLIGHFHLSDGNDALEKANINKQLIDKLVAYKK